VAITPLQTFLDKLPHAKRRANGWAARCPVHEGTHQDSLSISSATDGKVLVKCFAGCDAEAITKALGLSMRDLFPEEPHRNGSPSRAKPRAKPCTLAELAQAKALPVKMLTGLVPSAVNTPGVPK
jgi:putative DNA primase/helicase